ncbi:MAG: hypothetical protein ACI85O_000236, partial [Saprospiraceae bacterium]
MLGKLEDLPLKDIQIIPFNLNHAQKTGEFAKIIFSENKVAKEKLSPRAIIPNDSKLFAQADLDASITPFVTSDERSRKTLGNLKKGVRDLVINKLRRLTEDIFCLRNLKKSLIVLLLKDFF